MQTDNGITRSVWHATANPPQSTRLAEDVTADVCVVGAGIAGLTTAYLLAKEGNKVVVLDDGPTAGGESSRTTAHLVFYNDDGLTKIEKVHGFDGLKLATQSHSAAVDTIERIATEEAIDCDFKRLSGYLFVTPGGQDHKWLEQELDAAHRVGLGDAHWVDRAPLPSFDTGRCLCYPRQGRFHPLKYFAALAERITRMGSRVYNETHAQDIKGGRPATVTTAQGRTVTCDAVVVATNTPVNDRVTMHTKQHPYRTYVLGFKVRRGAIPDALYWDTLDPYHYIRLQQLDARHDVLISGGEDHKTGQANDPVRRFEEIEKFTRSRFPEAGEIAFRWSGQTLEPVDHLAFIGRNPGDADNVYIATGDSGMGMTHGTIAGLLLTDLILNRRNEWASLYDPSRKIRSTHAAATFVGENVNVAAQYANLATPGEVNTLDEIAPDTGAILRRGLKKVAVYKDAQGVCHERSAICTHLGCVVMWNGLEKSWDCPCHGSRFDPQGKPVNGPANTGLGMPEVS
jgi:glycine/D-amino acid oxidase-like deaminating enzyme/nitrite reductase/ring-hydroxylating ferredoxin subunit